MARVEETHPSASLSRHPSAAIGVRASNWGSGQGVRPERWRWKNPLFQPVSCVFAALARPLHCGARASPHHGPSPSNRGAADGGGLDRGPAGADAGRSTRQRTSRQTALEPVGRVLTRSDAGDRPGRTWGAHARGPDAGNARRPRARAARADRRAHRRTAGGAARAGRAPAGCVERIARLAGGERADRRYRPGRIAPGGNARAA